MKVIINEAEKKIELRLTKPSDFDSPVLLKTFPCAGYKVKPRSSDIDLELRPLIKEMHDSNYRTLFCCSGHRKTTGYVVFLPPKKRSLRVAVWEPNEPIPQKISGLKKVSKSSIIIDKGEDAMKVWLHLLEKKLQRRSKCQYFHSSFH